MAKKKKDKAREWTDKELEKMEKEITNTYKKASKDITKKWDAFMSSSEEKVSEKRTAYEDALLGGDQKEIEKAEKALKSVMTEQTLGNQYYKEMVDEVTTQLANTNQTALAYVNNQMPSIYIKNYNYIDPQSGKLLANNGIKFSLVDEAVVKKRIKEGDIKLPKKKVSIPADKRWNTKQLNSAVTQGIVQGESMNDIAKRIMPIVGNNKNAAIRNARTMVTGAENQGRLDRYRSLAEKGVVLNKVWMATGDDRTREWHLSMDGQEVDIEEPFIDGLGNEIMMPGDTDAPSETVYNCRCTTKSHILGFKKADGSVKYIDYQNNEKSSHQKEIEAERDRRTITSTNNNASSSSAKAGSTTVVNGKDMSQTWIRRTDKFDFAIEDIINAQGFDGLPRVVDSDEFDKFVQQSNVICQRGYTAPDKETLDAYRNQLYTGKWYVDCSNGGAAYGQGMYTAYNQGTKLDERISDIAARYAKSGGIGTSKNKVGYVETITIDPSAKIISYSDARTLADNIRKEYRYGSEKRKELEKELITKGMNSLDDIDDTTKQYVYDRYFSSLGVKEKDIDTVSWYTGLSEEERKKVDDYVTQKVIPISDNVDDIIESYGRVDEGQAAAMYGYDAIVAGEPLGEMVYLNRTKMIIKRSK